MPNVTFTTSLDFTISKRRTTLHDALVGDLFVFGCPSSANASKIVRRTGYAERSSLDHDTHDLVQRIGCRHGRMLGVGIVGRLKVNETVNESSKPGDNRKKNLLQPQQYQQQ